MKYSNEQAVQYGGKCPTCMGRMYETAYVQIKSGGSEVLARFGRDEIIHRNSSPKLPRLYGKSRIPSLLVDLRTATAIGLFNFTTYTKGRVDKMVVLKGEDQSVANKVSQSVKTQQERVTFDNFTGRVGREYHGTVWVGTRGDGAEVHDLIPPNDDMQTLDWTEFMLVKIVGAAYGVQPVMMNQSVRGPGGYFQKMQIAVNNDVTEEMQAMFEEPLNNVVFPKIGVYDYKFEFNPIAPKNELEEAQIWIAKIDAGQKAVNAGLTAELTEDGELKINGSFVKQEFPTGAAGYFFNNPAQANRPGGAMGVQMPRVENNTMFDVEKQFATRRDMEKATMVVERDGQLFAVTRLPEKQKPGGGRR